MQIDSIDLMRYYTLYLYNLVPPCKMAMFRHWLDAFNRNHSYFLEEQIKQQPGLLLGK